MERKFCLHFRQMSQFLAFNSFSVMKFSFHYKQTNNNNNMQNKPNKQNIYPNLKFHSNVSRNQIKDVIMVMLNFTKSFPTKLPQKYNRDLCMTTSASVLFPGSSNSTVLRTGGRHWPWTQQVHSIPLCDPVFGGDRKFGSLC